MLEQLKEKSSADLLMEAVCNVLKAGKETTPDIGGPQRETSGHIAVLEMWWVPT